MDDKADYPLAFAREFSDHHRLQALKTTPLIETLAFAQTALDKTSGETGAPAWAEKILDRALAPWVKPGSAW